MKKVEKLHLILAIHNHQPVGNFDHVIEDAYRKAYLPFLEVLRRHPKVKVVMHYSGHLLSWMEERHPEAIDILRGFVEEQKAEFLSGGFYEPILSALPDADRIMQVEALTEYVYRLFHCKPQGMWLAERVWEPQMPRYLSAAGIDYFPLDDYHFKLTGLDDKDLSGYFLTEDNGSSVKVFPGSEKLRYFIPFRSIEEILAYFKEVHDGGSPLLTMADDGEKFGVWPKTHKHCYEDGWLERFFSALEENSGWIETTTFSEYHSAFRPRGMVYLPTASYREMGEWVLPPEKGREYEHALTEMEKMFGERAKGMVRGGIWRSFFSKYPEANHIHKRMLMASSKVHEALERLSGDGSRLSGRGNNQKQKLKTQDSLLHELWKGQCNDAYWHGIFGGLYLPHLRSALYRHLIAAESGAEEVLSQSRTGSQRGEALIKAGGDLDCDGFNDLFVSTPTMAAFFSEQGGRLAELSLKRTRINVLDTLSRRHEAYHSRISEAAAHSDEARTIHDRLVVKEEGLSDYLVYDAYTRASLLDHFFPCDVLHSLSPLMTDYEDRGDFVDGVYRMNAQKRGTSVQVKLSRKGVAKDQEIGVEKMVKFHHSRVRADYLLEGDYSGVFGIEFNISLLGSPYATLSVKGKTLLIRDSGIHDSVKEFSVRDRSLDLWLTFAFDEEISLRHYPVETVSLSEEGVERIYQGTAFLLLSRLDFHGRKRLGFKIDFREAP